MENSNSKRIAIIGSGLSGLTTSYLLQKHGFDITIYEKAKDYGMDAASLYICCCIPSCAHIDNCNEKKRVDVPMRGLYPNWYPNVTSLYNHLEIPLKSVPHSLSFTEDKNGERDTFFVSRSIVWKGDEWTIPKISLSFPTPSSTYNLLKKIVKNPWESCREIVGNGYESLKEIWKQGRYWYKVTLMAKRISLLRSQNKLHSITGTILDFLKQEGFDDFFIMEIFLPLMAALCTCTIEEVSLYPARTILDFFTPKTERDGWFKYPIVRPPDTQFTFVECGINTVCKKLVSDIQDVRLNCGVCRVYFHNGEWIVEDEKGGRTCFDDVVFCTQAYRIPSLLQDDRFDYEKSLLERIPYVRSLVAVHSDESLMPKDGQNWTMMNFLHSSTKPTQPTKLRQGPMADSKIMNPEKSITGTHYLNLSHFLGYKPLFQTWNPNPLPDPFLTHSMTYFDRALVTMDSEAAIDELDEMQGEKGIWFVGSFVWPGIPLLEGCVQSARYVTLMLCQKYGFEYVDLINGTRLIKNDMKLTERYYRNQ